MKRMYFEADWTQVVFIHYRAPTAVLSEAIPFALDLREGCACVSLVAFTLSNMRLNICPALTRLLLRPLSEHQFLNVRTYVRQNDAQGIYFLTEWLNCRCAIALGAFSYGLPYRFAHITYDHRDAADFRGSVQRGGDALVYEGRAGRRPAEEPFLLERYQAFTEWRGTQRRFDVEHLPWEATLADVQVREDSLLRQTGRWVDGAELIGAHHSSGVYNVAMGFPRFLK